MLIVEYTRLPISNFYVFTKILPRYYSRKMTKKLRAKFQRLVEPTVGIWNWTIWSPEQLKSWFFKWSGFCRVGLYDPKTRTLKFSDTFLSRFWMISLIMWSYHFTTGHFGRIKANFCQVFKPPYVYRPFGVGTIYRMIETSCELLSN